MSSVILPPEFANLYDNTHCIFRYFRGYYTADYKMLFNKLRNSPKDCDKKNLNFFKGFSPSVSPYNMLNKKRYAVDTKIS